MANLGIALKVVVFWVGGKRYANRHVMYVIGIESAAPESQNYVLLKNTIKFKACGHR